MYFSYAFQLALVISNSAISNRKMSENFGLGSIYYNLKSNLVVSK